MFLVFSSVSSFAYSASSYKSVTAAFALYIWLRPQASLELEYFTLPAVGSDDVVKNGQVHLADFKGRTLVLYFYPKDDTPGCTKEACAFRDANRVMQQRGIVVLGVSADDVESHREFADKYSLPF